MSEVRIIKDRPRILENDAYAASMGGARGVMLFRFGLLNYINFNNV